LNLALPWLTLRW
jgi:hypothetical protein